MATAQEVGPAPLGRGSLPAGLRDLVRYRHLVRYLVDSNLRTEQTGTVFGFLWWILDPLLLTGVYYVLVKVFLNRAEPNFPIFILIALLSWEFFTSAVRNSMSYTLMSARAMRQVAFPRSVVPPAATLAKFAHFLFGLVVAAVIAAAGYGIYPHAVVLFAIPIAAVQLAFTLGCAFLLAAMYFYFRDLNHLTSYVFRLWFFLSPAIYSASRVPERWRHLYSFNPFAHFFPAYRAVILRHTLPALGPLGWLTLASLALLLVGFVVFVRLEPRFAKMAL